MKRLLLSLAATATMLTAGAANAEIVTFASYQQASTGIKSIQYVNNVGSAGGTLSDINMPLVNFQFASPATDGDGNVVNLDPSLINSTAQFWLNATSNSTATSSVIGGQTYWDQIFQSGTLGFKRVSDGANLLTISFTNMDFQGRQAGGSASTIASTPGSTILLTSDFFDFSNVVQSDFSFALSAVVANLSIGANGSFNSFNASSAGTFDSDPAPTYVPEPGMLGLFGFGAIGLMVARRRKK